MEPLIYSIQSILGFLQLLDTLKIRYYPTIHRATIPLKFNLTLSTTPILIILLSISILYSFKKEKLNIISIIPLIITPIMGFKLSISIASLIPPSLNIKRLYGKYVLWLLASLSMMKFTSLIHWAILIPTKTTNIFNSVAMLELSLFYILSYLIPLLILPLLYFWAISPLIDIGIRKIPKIRIKFNSGSSKMGIILLGISLMIGIYSAIYPYMKAVNPRGLNIGVDIPHYVEAAEEVEDDITAAFNLWGGARPLIFLVIYGFQKLIGLDSLTAVRMLPIILNPLLALTTFFLLYEAYKDPYRAGLGSLLTVSSYQIAVGMYSYFLTNMLGLILVYTSIAFLFKSFNEKSRRPLIYASMFGFLLDLTHPWTFDQYLAASIFLLIILLFRFYRDRENNDELLNLAIYVLSLIIFDFIRISLLRYGGSRRQLRR